MKAFVRDHIVDVILGFGLSSTVSPAWPGFDFEQQRWSKIEADRNLAACRKGHEDRRGAGRDSDAA